MDHKWMENMKKNMARIHKTGSNQTQEKDITEKDTFPQ